MRLYVHVLGAKDLLGPFDGELFDDVDELAAPVERRPGYPSAYLFVSGEPSVASTAGEAKFSDAMSSILVFSRLTSARIASAAWGSIFATAAQSDQPGSLTSVLSLLHASVAFLAFNVRYLSDATLVAPARKVRSKKHIHDRKSQFVAEHPPPKRQNVRVVVLFARAEP